MFKNILKLTGLTTLVLVFIALTNKSLRSQQNDNYIIERTYCQANGKTDSSLINIQYFDGLGRRIQLVNMAYSPDRKDIVTIVGYDAFGREYRKYLPYKASEASGAYRPNDLSPSGYTNSDQYKYYKKNGGNSNINIPDSDFPFAETVFEKSPLNRILQQGAPGEEWQPANPDILGSGHAEKYDYHVNKQSLSGIGTIRWRMNPTSGSLSFDGAYPSGVLLGTEKIDENGVARTEWKDSQGRVVIVSNGSYGQTRYFYDDFGRLRWVWSPELAAQMANASPGVYLNPTDPLAKAYAYYYEYDQRGRMTQKQIPGSDPIYMVYDARDRLVLTQDGNNRLANKWQFTKYDALNRPVMTGVYTHGTSVDQQIMQAIVDNFYTNPGSKFYEEIGSVVLGYTCQSFPVLTTPESYLSATYYDSYEPLTSANGFSNLYFIPKPGLIAYNNGYYSRIKGLVTGAKIKVLDGNENTSSAQWLYSVNYYDDQYRVIQTRGTLFGGLSSGNYTNSTRYSFSGLIEKTQEYQVFNGLSTETTITYIYDHVGRLLNTQQVAIRGGNSTGTVNIASNEYNDLGQLKTKKLANSKQMIDYSYNIRGWLTSINNPEDLGSDLFGMRLNYQNNEISGVQSQYNGNISSIIWNTNYAGKVKSAYGYTYDPLNRLTNSDYWTTVNGILSNTSAYEEKSLSYDKNGNIRTLVRTNQSGGIQDNLIYTYEGNRLKNLNTGSTFAYDRNGNLTTDGLRGLSIEYNLINLPKKVSKGTENVSYIYSSTGSKVAMLKGDIVQNYYAGSFVYKTNKTLDYLLHAEGIIRATDVTGGQTLSYEYFIKDHLGNTRVVFDNAGAVKQVTDYYAFGKEHTPLPINNGNRYLFNGKEQQDATLNGIKFDWYDYGARFYDPALGRWHSVDPHAEKYFSWSPYNYVYDNPINAVDPDGRDGIIIVFPQYKVDTEVKVGKWKAPKLPLGHAGVLTIDKKGRTRYYEYGRYATTDGTKGRVRRISVSNVKMGSDGKPTNESLNKVMGQISKKSGQGGEIRGAYIVSDKTEQMNKYAEQKLNESNPGNPDYNKDRESYDVKSNNCGTFAADVINQDESVDQPTIVNPTPNNIVDEYIEEGNAEVKYDPKSNTTTVGKGDEEDAKKKVKK